MKKMIIAIVIAVALIISGIVVTIVIINTPSIIMGPTISSAFSELMKRDDLKQIQNVLENGSIEFEAVDAESSSDMRGKLYFGLDEQKLMAENIVIKRGEVSLSGNFYASRNLCYAQSEQNLGGAFGIKSGNAAEEFEKSIFAFGSGSEFAVSKEMHDIIYEILSAYDEELSEDVKKDYAKLQSRYLANIQNSISKHGAFSSEKANVKVGETHMDARIMTLVLDETAIMNIVSEFLTFVAEDENFKDFIYTCGDKFDSVLSSKKINGAEELYNSIINEINAHLANLKTEYKESKIDLSIVTPKLSTKLLSFTLNIYKNGEKNTFSADFGPRGVRNSDLIKLNIDGNLIEYKRGSDNRSFSVTVEDFAKLTYYLDGNGGFELALLFFYEGEERYSISGTVETKKNVTTYDITNYRYTYNKSGTTGDFENIDEKQIDITVSISSKDKMPSPINDYEAFLELDNERFAVIEKNLTDVFAGLKE